MKALTTLREKAVKLRKAGLTYSEILKQVPVAQSSISIWCRNIPLTRKQAIRIDKISKEGILTAAKNRHNLTCKLKEETIYKASKEIKAISSRELWLIGIALYWAEGSKQNIKTVSQGMRFTNSDPYMIKLFDLWLTKIINIDPKDIYYEIYLHESMSEEKTRVAEYWSKILEKDVNKFDRIYLKRNVVTKKYLKSDYKGVVRIVVKRSTNLNRQISGWQKGIIQSAGW